jgi:hypothetical protein
MITERPDGPIRLTAKSPADTDFQLERAVHILDGELAAPHSAGPCTCDHRRREPGGTIRTLIDGEIMQEASTGDLVYGRKFLSPKPRQCSF